MVIKQVRLGMPDELHKEAWDYMRERNHEIAEFNNGRELVKPKLSFGDAIMELIQQGLTSKAQTVK